MTISRDHEPQFAPTQPAGIASQATIIFVDVCGSTGMYENLGNERATKTITKLTAWMSERCIAFGGLVIKTLGDGVLMRFELASEAVLACIDMQRSHEERILGWPEVLRAQLQMGLASGEVMDVQGDCYGDAVNVAARLAGMSGAGQIWINDVALAELPPGRGFHCRSLGPMMVRGKAEAMPLYLVEWTEKVSHSALTVPGSIPFVTSAGGLSASLQLSWLDSQHEFRAEASSLTIGRDASAQFIVADSRVSRQHVKIEWQTTPSGGYFVLQDLSSFGTWVRFAGSMQEVELRRSRCTISSDGELALGASFSDFSVPTVTFKLG